MRRQEKLTMAQGFGAHRKTSRTIRASAAFFLPALFGVAPQHTLAPFAARPALAEAEWNDEPDTLPPASSLPASSPDASGLPAATPERGDFAALLAGQTVPLTLRMNDLKTGWRRMTINAPAPNDAMRQAFAFEQDGDFGSQLFEVLGVSPGAYFSRGQTIAVGSDSFLIAYRVRFPPRDLEALPTSDPGVVRATQILTNFLRSRTLDLSLINLKNVGNLSDIRPFSIETQVVALQAMMKDSAREAVKNQDAASLSNLKQIGLGLIQYTQDYEETLPPMQNAAAAKKALFPYIKSEEMFLQPGSKTPYRPNPILSKKKLAHISDSARMVTFYEEKSGADGLRGVLFLDGHAKRLNEKEWQLFKRGSKIK